jgi:hypothetical protein
MKMMSSTLSKGIKNAVLLALVIAIGHVLLVSFAMAPPPRKDAVAAPPPPAAPHVVGRPFESSVAPGGSELSLSPADLDTPSLTKPQAAAPLRLDGGDDLHQFVFECSAPDAADAPAPSAPASALQDVTAFDAEDRDYCVAPV